MNGLPLDHIGVAVPSIQESAATYDTQVWGGEVPWRKYDQQIFEYACHEGNYALANVLSGARYEERVEAQGSR